jgi:hypothetical protein
MSCAFDVMRIWVELPLYVMAGLQRANDEPGDIRQTDKPAIWTWRV